MSVIKRGFARIGAKPPAILLLSFTLVLAGPPPRPATEGVVYGWGVTVLPNAEPGLRFTSIAAGGYHNLVLKADGRIAGWGLNDWGQSTAPAGLSNVAAIAAGGYHNLALKADGSVMAWGRNADGRLYAPLHSSNPMPEGLSNVVAVAAGGGHSLALKADGTVVAWGDNEAGQSTVPAGMSNVVSIAAGDTTVWRSELMGR